MLQGFLLFQRSITHTQSTGTLTQISTPYKQAVSVMEFLRVILVPENWHFQKEFSVSLQGWILKTFSILSIFRVWLLHRHRGKSICTNLNHSIKLMLIKVSSNRSCLPSVKHAQVSPDMGLLGTGDTLQHFFSHRDLHQPGSVSMSTQGCAGGCLVAAFTQ